MNECRLLVTRSTDRPSEAPASASKQTAIVPTAYADFLAAAAPSVDDVASFVVENHFPVLLIDTFGKEGRSLFDWLSIDYLCGLSKTLRTAGAELALAGSLKIEDIPKLQSIQPAWLAIRGAACRDSARQGDIDLARVRAIKVALRSPASTSMG